MLHCFGRVPISRQDIVLPRRTQLSTREPGQAVPEATHSEAC
jgi:hypothetical protein